MEYEYAGWCYILLKITELEFCFVTQNRIKVDVTSKIPMHEYALINRECGPYAKIFVVTSSRTDLPERSEVRAA